MILACSLVSDASFANFECFQLNIQLESLSPATSLKNTLAQVFSDEFCEIYKNTFFTEHVWTTASKNSEQQQLPEGFANSCYKIVSTFFHKK